MTTTTRRARRARNRHALLVLGTAGTLAIGACSSGATSTTSAPAGTSSATTTTGSGQVSSSSGADLAAGSTVPGTTFGTQMMAALRKAGSGRATMTVTQGGTRTDLRMEFAVGSGDAIQAHATMSGGLAGSAGTEVVVADGATYVKLAKAVGGRTWLRTTATDGVAPDPASIATSFSGAEVVYVGEEGGLRHYTVTAGGVGAGTVQAYLDDQGRPSRFTGRIGAVALEATYSDWGTPVTVTPPPASQVTTSVG